MELGRVDAREQVQVGSIRVFLGVGHNLVVEFEDDGFPHGVEKSVNGDGVLGGITGGFRRGRKIVLGVPFAHFEFDVEGGFGQIELVDGVSADKEFEFPIG